MAVDVVNVEGIMGAQAVILASNPLTVALQRVQRFCRVAEVGLVATRQYHAQS